MELGSFGSDAEDGFAEAVNAVGGSFEGLGGGIFRWASDDHLNRMVGEEGGSQGIRTGRGRILQGFAADVEAAHGGGIGGTVEAAAAFGVAVASDGEVHGFLCDAKIAVIERGFVSVEEREDAENLIVERAFEGGAADAVAEAASFAPDFFQDAVECFQGEGAGSCAM